MRRRHALVIASGGFALLGLACVDLFHKTNFETLCAQAPDDPQCTGDNDAAGDVADAGIDTTRPHADFCAWSQAEARAQALHACAWLGACEGPFGESAFGPCVGHALLAFDCVANPSLRPNGAVDAFWGCLSTVKTCGEVDACVFPAGVQNCVAVPGGSSSACGTLGGNATTRLKCAGPAGRAVGIEPCVMLGKTCTVETETPSVASCSGSLGFDKCTTTECSGTKAVDCQAAGARKLDHGIDCALFGGATCLERAGQPICGGGAAAQSCSSDSFPFCNGSVLSTCVGGKNIVVDCSHLDVACDVSQPLPTYDPTAGCVLRGKCTEADTCTGSTIRSCGRGAPFTLDCATVGLPGCFVGASGLAACKVSP